MIAKRKRTHEVKEHLLAEQNVETGNGTIHSNTAGIQNERSESSPFEISDLVVSLLSNAVVSLASFSGGTLYRRCAGTIIKSMYSKHTLLLTSACLVRSSYDENKIIDNLTIKVCLPDNQVVIGLLHHYDLKYDIAVVDLDRVHGFRAVNFGSRRQTLLESNSKVVAAGRCFDSGMFTIANGTAILGPKDELFSELSLSTSKSSEVLLGGPLVGLDGYFGGMSCYGCGRAAFLPRNRIIECLRPFGLLWFDFNYCGDGTRKRRTFYDEDLENLCEASRRNGYPLPIKLSGYEFPFMGDVQMRVINCFEKVFDGDIWSTLSKGIDSKMSDCVVSLASFAGDARCFACSGIFINRYPARILTSASLVRKSDDENDIDDNLWIQVSLRNERRVKGTLKHYNLHYNVAVVDIMGFCSHDAMDLERHISFVPNIEVIALGCRFNERQLMATDGVLTDRQSKLDCKDLKVSTCKITKAGIGGPLIDSHGNFVGMNFYGNKETPYLPRNIIQKVLKSFDEKRHTAAETIHEVVPNRWPVPKPYWYYPCIHDFGRTFEEIHGELQGNSR